MYNTKNRNNNVELKLKIYIILDIDSKLMQSNLIKRQYMTLLSGAFEL